MRGIGSMSLLESVRGKLGGVVRNGKRVFAPSVTGGGSELVNALNSFQGMNFSSLPDFLSYYKEDLFHTAYTNLDPMTCYQLKMTNPWLGAAADAISMPLAAAEIVPVPLDPSKPDLGEISYLSSLMELPNEFIDGFSFRWSLANDLLCTGEAYVEVAYNEYGFPSALYRHAPHKMDLLEVDGEFRYIHKSGAVFNKDNLITIFNPNPFSDYKGFSPVVQVFMDIMLDSSLMKHQLSYFNNDALKGIISLSDKMPVSAAETETTRMQNEIREMKRRGDTGHLVMYGATFQAISATNRDMLVPEVKKGIIDAICAVYHVPPSKISQIDTGNIGSGTGEAQDETMNETLNHWGKMIISALNSKLLRLAGVENSALAFKNLTKKDEARLAELYKIKIESGQMTIDEARAEDGKAPYNLEHSNTPLVPINRVPLSLVDKQRQLGFNGSSNALARLEGRLESIGEE